MNIEVLGYSILLLIVQSCDLFMYHTHFTVVWLLKHSNCPKPILIVSTLGRWNTLTTPWQWSPKECFSCFSFSLLWKNKHYCIIFEIDWPNHYFVQQVMMFNLSGFNYSDKQNSKVCWKVFGVGDLKPCLKWFFLIKLMWTVSFPNI